jgi:hypothetical protein
MPTAEEILAQQSEEWKKSDASGTWYPEDGEYAVMITEVKTEVRGNLAWINVTGEIQNGEYEGRTFPVLEAANKTFFLVKTAVQALGGDPDAMESPLDAVAFLKDFEGAVINVRKYRSSSNGKTFDNVRILGIAE